MHEGCLFCGGDASEPDHFAHCDGRQGHAESFGPDLHARTDDPETSHASMAAYDVDQMRSAMALVVRLHRRHGPMAEFELLPRFRDAWPGHADESLHRQARNQARNAGLISNSGMQRLNPITHRKQVVWEARAGRPPALTRCPTCGRVRRDDRTEDPQ
jgi:hypothetical protein